MGLKESNDHKGPKPVFLPCLRMKHKPIQIPARVFFFFDSGSSRSFVHLSFVLHTDRELSPLKNKLVVTTPLGEQILRSLIFKGCEILVKGIVLKANLIPLEMFDFDVILEMDWLSNH